MNNKFILESSEIKRILSLHEQAKEEQKQKTRTESLKFFGSAKQNGCLTDSTLVYDQIYQLPGDTRHYIKGPSRSRQGAVKRVFDDFTYELFDPTTKTSLKKGTWSCNQLMPKPELAKPKELNQNQLDVISWAKKGGWFEKPVPSDVAIEQGIFQKMDLTDPQSEYGVRYSKYFPKEDFPNGFFLYKKITTETTETTKAQRVKISTESCRIAIDDLYDKMTSPNSVILSDEQLIAHVETAKKCAEPENRKSFLNFAMNKKLKRIASRYGIKL